MRLKTLLFIALVGTLLHQRAFSNDDAALRSLADEYLDAYSQVNAPDLYWYGFETLLHTDRFYQNSKYTLQAFHAQADAIEAKLKEIDAAKLPNENARLFRRKFIEHLESNKGVRVCKRHLWGISHWSGPHIYLGMLVNRQAVDTEQQRLNVIRHWQEAVQFYKQELANLEEGLEEGYSAPKSVVERVIKQHENLINIEISAHPFMAITKRTDDKAFIRQFRQVLSAELLPAMGEYKEFLEKEYLAKARDSRAISKLPQGRECYIAMYRYYTTLERTPESVHKLGKQTVARQKQQVIALGKASFDSDNFSDIIQRVKGDESKRFKSSEEMHDFYVRAVEQARAVTREYFDSMPKTELVIKPVPEHLQGDGMQATYDSGTKSTPATFNYDPSSYADTSYAGAEIIAVHESYPGHHLQIGLAQDLEPFHALEKLFVNGAFLEGWGRYSEVLAEEIGIIQTDATKILRRAWPARGMVADTGLHLFGWSDKFASDYLRESGSDYTTDMESLLDRMAVMPAQLTSYDSGALEILSLREELKQKLGDAYSLKEFHRRLLKNGTVPMSVLREQVLADQVVTPSGQ